MARPYPWKCRSCGEKAVVPATVDYFAELEHDGRAYSFVVPQLELLQCSVCLNRTLPDTAMNRVLDRLREEANLLSPARIKEERKRLDLTQEQLASYLKVAKETVSRWETGGQIQQRGYDTLLRVFFEVPEAREYLMAAQPVRPQHPPEFVNNFVETRP